jgi:Flp pilus assembly pilin Flp
MQSPRMLTSITSIKTNRRGAVAVEYAFLLVIVAIPTVLGVIAGGVKLLADYDKGRLAIIAPSP